MKNIERQIFEPAYRLVKYFGTQKKAGAALNVEQGTISGWLRGTHGINSLNAQKAEKLTNGEIKAYELCPKLLELEDM